MTHLLEVTDISWPQYSRPAHVEAIERVPLAERGVPTTTLAVLRRAAAMWPDRVAMSVMPDASRWREAVDVTFAALLEDAGRVANLLRCLGVDAGAPVGIMSPNCAQLIPVMFGAQAAGVAVPLNGGLSVDHLATLMERTGIRVLLAAGPELDGTSWSKALELVERTSLDVVLVLEPTVPSVEPADLPRRTSCSIAYLRTAWDGQPTDFDDWREPDDLAAIFHTGGTTGTPKLAAHTHRNQTADAWMIAADSGLRAEDTVLAALPLFHVNALHVTMLAPMLKGQRVVWAGPQGFRDPSLYANIWRIVEHFGVATMSAVPTVYAVLAGCPVDADITTLRQAVVGASALPDGVRKSFEEHTGVPLLEGYGLTEGTCASARSFLAEPRHGSVGKRLPCVKDLIIRGGHNIDPAAIEATLLVHPDVADAAAVGRPDPRAGEVPVAFVVPVPGSTLTEADLRSWVTGTDLEPAARPRTITIRDSLPVTDVGKPYKLALRADAAESAVRGAVTDYAGVVSVTGRVVDGSVAVTVVADTSADVEAIRAELGRLALATDVVAGAQT
jgi:fatty-acyl-CoA synthase